MYSWIFFVLINTWFSFKKKKLICRTFRLRDLTDLGNVQNENRQIKCFFSNACTWVNTNF